MEYLHKGAERRKGKKMSNVLKRKSKKNAFFTKQDTKIIGRNDFEKCNADRIRSMTDEELAEWLTNMCEFEENGEPYKSIYNLDAEKEEEIHDSYGDLLKWLKTESEG